MNKNNMSQLSLLILWFGASVSISEILTGGLLAPLGFQRGFIAIILGHIIGVVLLYLGGLIGSQSRLASIESTQISFGIFGTKIFSVLNILQLIGWTAIMIISGATSANAISKILWQFDHITFWSIVIGLLICLWIILKSKGSSIINIVAVSLLFILTIVLSTTIFNNPKLFTKPVGDSISFGTALELNVIMPLSWLPLIADYTRQGSNKKWDSVLATIGYFIGSTWMYTIGLGASIVSGNSDPSAIMLAANLGIVALSIVVLSTITTTFIDAYSAGVTCLNLLPKAKESHTALAMSILGTLLAIFINMSQYESFLYMIGSVFGPLFAILLTDYFIFKEKEINPHLQLHYGKGIIWIIGIVLYYQLINLDFILGTTVPVIILTSLLYILLRKVVKHWHIQSTQNHTLNQSK